MNRKKLEDWFVESAAFLVVRVIFAIMGFGVTLLVGERLFLISTGSRPDETFAESYDRTFYFWLLFAAIVAAIFAVVGPALFRAITGTRHDR